jgi:hypothetical protein
MSEQSIQDLNDGKPWSEMDLFDLRNSLAYGRSIEEVNPAREARGVAQAAAAMWVVWHSWRCRDAATMNITALISIQP